MCRAETALPRKSFWPGVVMQTASIGNHKQPLLPKPRRLSRTTNRHQQVHLEPAFDTNFEPARELELRFAYLALQHSALASAGHGPEAQAERASGSNGGAGARFPCLLTIYTQKS